MHNRDKTRCPQGHPYNEENTIWYVKKDGDKRYRTRKCAICMRALQKRNRERYHAKERTPEEIRRRAVRVKRWREQHPEKHRAWLTMWNAIRRGELVRPEVCERCGASGVRIEGSHNDYDKPLEVEWLCSPCHGAKDRKYGAVQREDVSC